MSTWRLVSNDQVDAARGLAIDEALMAGHARRAEQQQPVLRLYTYRSHQDGSGFGTVVAIGEYLLDPENNMAEIAFSVSKKWQRKGLAKIIIRKLAEAAHENDISGFYAYTTPQNAAMIGLFKALPYKVSTVFETDVIKMSCRFDALSG